MGDGVRQSEADAIGTLALAHGIVDAETNGVDWPKLAAGRARHNPFCGELDEPSKSAVRGLATELVIASLSLVQMQSERDAAIRERDEWRKRARDLSEREHGYD